MPGCSSPSKASHRSLKGFYARIDLFAALKSAQVGVSKKAFLPPDLTNTFARPLTRVSSPNVIYDFIPKTQVICDCCKVEKPQWRFEAESLSVTTLLTSEKDSFRGDFYLCGRCAWLLEKDDEPSLVALAHAAGRRFFKDGMVVAGMSEAQATARAVGLIVLMRRSRTASQPFPFDVDHVDYRLGYTSGFNPGTLPRGSVTDRPTDAHAWLANQAATVCTFQEVRTEYRRRFGFVIPNEQILSRIAQFSPHGALDWGAGNGYLAYLLSAIGVDALAVDVATVESGYNAFWSPKIAKFRKRRSWMLPQVSNDKHLTQTAGRTLILAWPPAQDPMAAECLSKYRGSRVIYIGEWRRATANDDFHELLSAWHKVAEVVIPTHYGLRDRAYFYER